MDLTVTKTRSQNLLDERKTLSTLHEALQTEINKNDDKQPTEAQKETRAAYRERMASIDAELADNEEVLKREEESARLSNRVRTHLASVDGSGTIEDNVTKWRSFATYARDELIVRYPQIASLAGGEPVRKVAVERLQRAPQHTLSEDVEGLQPPQHIAQIMDVIDSKRPLIASARRVTLERGQLTYPAIAQRPEVLEQATEKTEGGTIEMQVDMEGTAAHSFIGGGNLSWQAINWSTPDALELWFQLAAESYAKKAELFVGSVLTTYTSGTIAAPVAGTSSFPQWLAGVVAGVGAVYDNSGADADTLYLSSDLFAAVAGKASDQQASFIAQGGVNLAAGTGVIAGLSVVRARGLGSAKAYVGDSSALIVAENPGAPVELRSTEPEIGGFKVGVIGAVAAAVFDGARFCKITA